MLLLTTAQRLALEKRHVMRRFFLWFAVKNLDGDDAPLGFWDDVGNVEVPTPAPRTYVGGELPSDGGVSSLSLKGDLTIPGLSVTLSGTGEYANLLVRGRKIAQAPMTAHIGIFDVDTREIIPPLIPYFVGFVDDVDIQTPEPDGVGRIALTCESASRALTRKSTATRSDAFARARDSDDALYLYTALQRDRPSYFGRKDPKK